MSYLADDLKRCEYGHHVHEHHLLAVSLAPKQLNKVLRAAHKAGEGRLQEAGAEAWTHTGDTAGCHNALHAGAQGKQMVTYKLHAAARAGP